MPCHNKGVCTPVSPEIYECVCPTGYSGKTCEKSSFSKWLADGLSLDRSIKLKLALTRRLLWAVINRVPFLHDAILRYLYLSGTNLGGSYDQILHYRHNYDLLSSYKNGSYFSRGLPPVPLECPTPLGIKGPSALPDVKVVYDQLFQRTQFKPCHMRTNVMFATFAQYLTYQYFKSNHFHDDFPLDNDDAKFHGFDDGRKKCFRSLCRGKLKVSIINGEEYPPYLEDVPGVVMNYPQPNNKHVLPKWAMTHYMFSITPFMFAVATIWLREHNRVCDIITKAHPDWNDERIYQTARWIVLGELLTITTGEYFQHLTQCRLKLGFKPNLIHDDLISSSNRMQYEFTLAFQWHQMMPDSVYLQGKAYNLSHLIFSNNRIVFEHGLDAIVDLMSRTPMGKVTHQNCGTAFGETMQKIMREGRRSRLHSFNDYRKFFGLKPYESFEELTGEKKVSKVLRDLYGDIDAVEFIVGCFLEKHVGSVIPPTMLLLTGPVALRAILNNPIGSATLWRESTFGGKIGFDIVQKASLKKLFCLNLKGNCKNNVWVSFKTPHNAFRPSR